MPANKKPRKAYRPRQKIDPVDYVLTGMRRISKDGTTSVMSVVHAAMFEIVQGRGTTQHWSDVAGALNMAMVLDEQVYGGAHQESLRAALKAHARCGMRGFNGHTLGYSSADLQAVNHCLVVHDVQMERATVNEIERAMAECRRRDATPGLHFTAQEAAEQGAA